MPRALRVQAPGVIYHVFTHATGDELLYRDDRDRERFLSILRTVVRTYALELHFFTVLGTHHHLLLTTPKPNIATAMQYLNGTYCRTYNRRHRRKGHLVGGRYGTVIVESEAHGAWLVPYLAMNAVWAGLVDRPEDWPWSSYAALIGEAADPGFLDPGWVLRQFAADPARARVVLRRYVESLLGATTPRA